MVDSHTDCRSEDGITVGLIDSIISICRVLKDRNFDSKEISESLHDLRQDEDFNHLMYMAMAAVKAKEKVSKKRTTRVR
jgi:hypothetical protein